MEKLLKMREQRQGDEYRRRVGVLKRAEKKDNHMCLCRKIKGDIPRSRDTSGQKSKWQRYRQTQTYIRACLVILMSILR